MDAYASRFARVPALDAGISFLERFSLGRLIVLAWVVMLALFLPALAVFAQEADGVIVTVPPTSVVFEWGDFLAILLANLAEPDSVAWTIFGLAAAWVVSRLPAPLKWTWRMFQVEQLLAKSLAAGMNSTANAVQGQKLDVDVGNHVVAGALQYAVDNGSKAAIDWAGGNAGIHNKLVARLDLKPGAAIPLVPQK